MSQEKYWAILNEESVCENIVTSSTGEADVQNNWVEISPSKTLGDIVGLQYQEGTWVDPRNWEQKRVASYRALNQFEMMYDDAVNGTTTWVDAIAAIKAEIPKE